MTEYFQRKLQLGSNTPRQEIVDVGKEIEKKRSSSPAPKSSNIDLTNKKVIYKTDLENLKNDLSGKHADLASKHGEVVSNVSSVKSQVDILNKTVEGLNAKLDISKVADLKANLNDSITKINSNLENVCAKLLEHHDKLNLLQSKIDNIENIL